MQTLAAFLDFTYLKDDDRGFADFLSAAARIKPAAVCVYPHNIRAAKQALPDTPVASVLNFPDGQTPTPELQQELGKLLAAGCDEIDVVFDYRAYLAGNRQAALEQINILRQHCPNVLKVILESGQWSAPTELATATQALCQLGVDFIKTSTGKTQPGATQRAATTILKTLAQNPQHHTGIKLSGGIRDHETAQAYLSLAAAIMGPDWVTPEHFRIGASSTLS